MEVHLQMMIQDPRFSPVDKAKLRIEGYIAHGEEFADGPSNSRVMVLDMDPNTGTPLEGAVFCQPEEGGPGTYRLRDRDGKTFIPPVRSGGWGRRGIPARKDIDITSSEFNQVSVMATVLKTMELYEKPDVLGRPVAWGFEDPQIMVMPRAGYDENAGYCRLMQRLEFGYFTSHVAPADPDMPPDTVYTSLSRDVVAHETGHAILDGIARHLIESGTATHHSLALHEAIADITALLVSVASAQLRLDVLATTDGQIDNATNFSSFAEQFGMEGEKRSPALRDLRNHKKMGEVDPREPHNLSEVLAGALFAVLVRMYDKRWTAYTGRAVASGPQAQEELKKRKKAVSGKALWDSSEQFKRMTLRALDYLPPGPILFADYARAVIASDAASHPKDTEECGWLKEELLRRDIVPDVQVLEPKTLDVRFDDFEPEVLRTKDAAARALGEKYRSQLGIPGRAEIEVCPRLKATKKYFHRGGVEEERTECILKYAWSDPDRPELMAGTTLAIDWDTKRPTVLLSTNPRELEVAGPAPEPGALAALQARMS